jgi:hypothetical protein
MQVAQDAGNEIKPVQRPINGDSDHERIVVGIKEEDPHAFTSKTAYDLTKEVKKWIIVQPNSVCAFIEATRQRPIEQVAYTQDSVPPDSPAILSIFQSN